MKTISTLLLLLVPGLLVAGPNGIAGEEKDDQGPCRYNVVWDSASRDASGSMPLGNGDIGLNAWVEKSGDLQFYISKTDSWGDNGRLLKVGKVRIRLDPRLAGKEMAITQELSLADATLLIRIGTGEGAIGMRLWVDANLPVIHVAIEAPDPIAARASIELWRTERFTLPSLECSDVMLNRSRPNQQHAPTVVEPDSIVTDQGDRIGWYHHNSKSVGPEMTAAIQGLGGFERPDPLLHRTFGALIAASNGRKLDDLNLQSPRSRTHCFSIHVLTEQPARPEEWQKAIEKSAAAVERVPFAERRENHEAWWLAFWNRSWIHVTPGAESKSRPPVPPNSYPLRVGADQHDQNCFTGEFGRLSLFETALPESDVQALFQLARTGLLKERPGLLYSERPLAGAPIEILKNRSLEKGLTIEVWVKPGSLPAGGGRIVDKITPGGQDGFLLDTWPGNSLRLIVGSTILQEKDALPAGSWSHVAAVIDPAGGRIGLHLNGKRLVEKEIVSGDDAFVVSRAYALQRYINACAGRGRFPIKFNGSIFTVPYPDKPGDGDYRRWGPGYWWQNTRLPYISMCSSGDFDLMQPLFTMYGRDLMPLFRYRTNHYLGHEGVFIPECIYFWGDVFSETYGWTPFEKREDKLQESGWHKWEWVAGPELVFMMLDYYEHTLDVAFLRETLLPTAHEIVTFFDRHYKRDESGTLVMFPSQACETWWDCTNPMPEVAGLHAVTDRLLSLPAALTTSEQRTFWARMKKALPELPLREKDGKRMLAPAERFEAKRNIENPELYAVFPFRLVAVGKPRIELGREALAHRWDRGNFGWRQDDIFMAYLGLTGQARDFLVGRAGKKHEGSRFPAFWGPNYDWIPDQDHGSIVLKALQAMILQTEGKKIFMLPAWPADWNVDFKLHAPFRTVLRGSVRGGRIEELDIDPPHRRKDLIFLKAE